MSNSTMTRPDELRPSKTVSEWSAAAARHLPLGFEAGDENLYRYVDNNPTNATDPSGLERWSDWNYDFNPLNIPWYVNHIIDEYHRGWELDRQAANNADVTGRFQNVRQPLNGPNGQTTVGSANQVMQPGFNNRLGQARTESEFMAQLAIYFNASAPSLATTSGINAFIRAIPTPPHPLRAMEGSFRVWQTIRPTQGAWVMRNLQTVIPRSFSMTTRSGARVWVHPNASEHLAEYVISGVNPANATAPALQNSTLAFRGQTILADFHEAVSRAVSGGYVYGRQQIILTRFNRWEIIIGQPRQSGQAPTVFHALFRPR